MDKRSFLKSFSAKATSATSAASQFSSLNSLNPYTGPWDKEHAVHLLSRTTFGHNLDMIEESMNMGLELTVEKLLEDIDIPTPPIHYGYENDPLAALGEVWVYTQTLNIQGNVQARRRSLRAWQIGKIHEAGMNLREKMVLFWHEHLPISNIGSPRMEYQYLDIFQRNALGNFKTIMDEITISPAMLIYLNGNQNTKESPNENFSRELVELFTLGRGEAVGDGDYTNYTEQDVAALARSLTGWVARELSDDPMGLPFPQYVQNRHDTGSKQLSHRFDNIVIENGNEAEYKQVLDIIFNKSETALHLCRQLHIWFAGSEITEDVELNVLGPMAQIIIDQDYEIKDALRAFLSSEYFNDPSRRGCLINSPIDFMFKVFNNFEVTFPDNILVKYGLWARLQEILTVLEMNILTVPSVAGWKAYYQTPQFYQYWINAVTLNIRDQFIQLIANGVSVGDLSIRIDYLELISRLEFPTDPNLMIEEAAQLAFVAPLSQNQIDYLKDVLIPGLPDFEWTIEYSDYLENPDDEAIKNAVESKLMMMFNAMMRMPEFYLM